MVTYISGVVSAQRAKGEECTLRYLGRDANVRHDTGLDSVGMRMEGVRPHSHWDIGSWQELGGGVHRKVGEKGK